jgi:hypothetical protein
MNNKIWKKLVIYLWIINFIFCVIFSLLLSYKNHYLPNRKLNPYFAHFFVTGSVLFLIYFTICITDFKLNLFRNDTYKGNFFVLFFLQSILFIYLLSSLLDIDLNEKIKNWFILIIIFVNLLYLIILKIILKKIKIKKNLVEN